MIIIFIIRIIISLVIIIFIISIIRIMIIIFISINMLTCVTPCRPLISLLGRTAAVGPRGVSCQILSTVYYTWKYLDIEIP